MSKAKPAEMNAEYQLVEELQEETVRSSITSPSARWFQKRLSHLVSVLGLTEWRGGRC